MKVKTYQASTQTEAMAQVRNELGENAILVSVQRLAVGMGVRITAAIEDDDDLTPDLVGDYYNESYTPIQEKVDKILRQQGATESVIEKVVSELNRSNRSDELVAFASAMDAVFKFHTLPEKKGQAFMLVGPAGAGKTTIIAKLANRGLMSGKKIGLISADVVRLGAAEQLVAYTNTLDIALTKARSPENLHNHVEAMKKSYDLILIDMPACNPFLPEDIDYLSTYIKSANVTPILVLPAGIDPVETAETAECFSEIGVSNLIATKLDAARRFGGILSAMDAARLTISEASTSYNINKGLSVVNAVSLARLLLSSQE